MNANFNTSTLARVLDFPEQAIAQLRDRTVKKIMSLEEAMLYILLFPYFLFAYLQNTPYLCTNKNTRTIYLL